MTVLFAVVLAMAALSVANVGLMVSEKIRAQNAVDAAAYSAATVQARYMNLSAYINRAVIANYNAMAFDMALWSDVDALDHGLSAAAGSLYTLATLLFYSGVGTGFFPFAHSAASTVDAVHDPAFHTFNRVLKSAFDVSGSNANKYLELYNVDVLHVYQGMLYAAAQASRANVIENVAQRIDPNIQTKTLLGLGAETVNYDELAGAVDFVVPTPKRPSGSALGAEVTKLSEIFDKMAGTDKQGLSEQPYLLGAVTESSLDRFAAGKLRKTGENDTLRNMNTQNLFGGNALAAMLWAIKMACKATEWPWELIGKGYSCDNDMTLTLGSEQRWGNETANNQPRVPIINNRRIREVNGFIYYLHMYVRISKHVRISFDSVPIFGHQGYTSAPYNYDYNNIKNFVARKCTWPWQCMLNFANAYIGLVPFGQLCTEKEIDVHWDGNFDYGAAKGPALYPPVAAQGARIIAKYIKDANANTRSQGAPPYEWKHAPLTGMGFPNYYYPASRSDVYGTRTISGPSVGVIGVKPADKIRNLHVLRIGNNYPITATARAQVYYLMNPNRPREKPSTFNPHWAARLAPLESSAAPPFLRRDAAYIAAGGLTLPATH